jgi:hypothetical protein
MLHIGVAGDAGPVLGKDLPAERIDFAERDGSHPGPFEAEAETSDAGKEVEDIHLPSPGVGDDPTTASPSASQMKPPLPAQASHSTE